MTKLKQIEHHTLECEKAKKLYIASRTPEQDASDWNESLRQARKLIADALRASNYLIDIPKALIADGSHMLVFRHIAAPPVSQDQFALMCPAWRKGTEKPVEPGRKKRAMPRPQAEAAAAAFMLRRSRPLTPWIDSCRQPLKREVLRLLWSVAPSIANQQLVTLQRTKAANAQESAVTALLSAKGWTRMPSSQLDTRASLPAKHYMHKTRYATGTASPQEVDIAIGLGKTVVLAMECKVSNDATNSVKRINDVLKKASAWKEHWGNFVKTAALLQGVIAPKEIERLLDADVEVFWSHDLASFSDWIDGQV